MWDQIRRSRLHPDYPPFVDLWLREARRSFIAVEGDATDYGIMLALTMRRVHLRTADHSVMCECFDCMPDLRYPNGSVIPRVLRMTTLEPRLRARWLP